MHCQAYTNINEKYQLTKSLIETISIYLQQCANKMWCFNVNSFKK